MAVLDSNNAFRFAPLTGPDGSRLVAGTTAEVDGLGSLLVAPADSGPHDEPLQKAAAILFIVRRLDWPWRLLGVARFLPSSMLNWIYDQIARHRHLLSGGSGACMVPAPPRPPSKGLR